MRVQLREHEVVPELIEQGLQPRERRVGEDGSIESPCLVSAQFFAAGYDVFEESSHHLRSFEAVALCRNDRGRHERPGTVFDPYPVFFFCTSRHAPSLS